MKFQEPFRDIHNEFNYKWHDPKLNKRLTVPILFKALHITQPLALSYLTLLAIVGGMFCAGWVVFAETGDKLLAVLYIFFCSQTYNGMFAPPRLFYDHVALFFVTICFFRKHAWIAGVSAFLALWCDERALVALLSPAAYHAFVSFGKSSKNPDSRKGPLLAIGLATAITFVLRRYLDLHFGLVTPILLQSLASCFVQNIGYLHVGVIYAWEGGWILFLMVVAALLNSRYRLIAAALVALACLTLLSGFLVGDISRSLSFAFPMTLLLLLLGWQLLPRDILHRAMLYTFLSSCALSNYVIHPDSMEVNRIQWVRPLPVELLEKTALHLRKEAMSKK
jgi:hypothetical protein